MAYKLDLPATSHIHDVVHVSQLKRHVPPQAQVHTDLSLIRHADSPSLVPVTCLDRMLIKKGNVAVIDVLVQWSGLPPELATWEPLRAMETRYPSVRAWGQAAFQGEGHVTDST